MTFRFVHAADIHLDSPLRSLALRDPDLAALIGNATRQAFVAIVDLCLEEQVDALLLAGDLYDGDQTSMKTARFLGDQLRRLHAAGIQVFIIRGNHDALSRITKELTFPDSVRLFGGRAQAIAVDRAATAVPITIHGISFAQAHAPESLLPKYRKPVEGAVNIALLHTSLDGAPGHDPYAPCRLVDLHEAGFRYWALGHIHARAAHQGDAHVVMPGIPQGRDINEAGAKSVTLVTVADDGTILIEERATSMAQFERVEVDLAGITDWRGMVDVLATKLGEERDAAISPHLVARLQLTGATPLAWALRRDPDLLLAEATNQAAALGRCWIEAVRVDCAPPAAADATDPVSELRRIVEADILPDALYRADAQAIIEELRGQLPPECRSIFGDDEAAAAAFADELARDGIADVLARLQAVPDA